MPTALAERLSTTAALIDTLTEPLAAAPEQPIGMAAVPAPPRLRVATAPRPQVRLLKLGPNFVLDPATEAWLREPHPIPMNPEPVPPPPDPTATCCTVVRAAVEVLRGERPPAQLARWLAPVVLNQLTLRAGLLAAHRRRTGQPQPEANPVLIRRVRVQQIGATAEATVIVQEHGRCRAAALHLEATRGKWRVTVLELG